MSDADWASTKRPRLAQVDTQHRESRGPEQLLTDILQPILQQPRPRRANESFAPFLRDFVDSPLHGRPGFVHSFVSKWLESVVSDRETHCKSDSYLYCSTDESIPTKRTRSAPESNSINDSYESVSTMSPSYFTTETWSSSKKSTVETPLYRDQNLAANNIYIRRPFEGPLPQHTTDLLLPLPGGSSTIRLIKLYCAVPRYRW
ncbi:hypothetical protein GGR58DRAFT_501136 [Xylaria digitata]|nr:hypothetical protein GGR58DRAFT_501136 [Xylaria digitata]